MNSPSLSQIHAQVRVQVTFILKLSPSGDTYVV